MNLISMSCFTFKMDVRDDRCNGKNLEPRSQKTASSLTSAISHPYNWENCIIFCPF